METSKMAAAGTGPNNITDLGNNFVDLAKKYNCTDFSDIAKCFITLHHEITKEFGGFTKQMGELKNEVKDLRECIEVNAQDIEQVKADKDGLKTDTIEIAKNLLTHQVWTRKWNLIFRGIEGMISEKPSHTEQKVRKFITEQLGMSSDGMLFAACHRLPAGPDDKKNIIVKFVSVHDKDKCLEGAYKLPRGCGYGVSVDLPMILAKQRQQLLQKKNALADDKKKKAKIIYTRFHPFLMLKYPGGKMEADINYVTT